MTSSFELDDFPGKLSIKYFIILVAKKIKVFLSLYHKITEIRLKESNFNKISEKFGLS